MTIQDIFNADLNSVGRWLGQGLRWWGRELAELAPSRLRQSAAREPPWRAVIVSGVDGVQLYRRRALADHLARADGQARTVDLVLPPEAVLVLELDLPRLSPADLRRLLDLNIDRYTPFQSQEVHFDAVALDADGAKQRVGVLTRDRAQTFLSRASALGLTVARMGVAADADPSALTFDFMRSIKADRGGGPLPRRTVLWGVCAGLLALNVIVAVLRDLHDVSQLEQAVDSQRPVAAQATRLRLRIAKELARRQALLTRRSVHEPLRILDAVTRDLPQGVWVQRLEWNGQAVRLVGFGPPDFDVLAAVQGPALRNPRSMLSDMPTKGTNDQAPFDVMADSAARSPR